MKRKLLLPTLFLLFSFLLGNCNLPRISITMEETSTPVPVLPTDTVTPPPSAELGLAENPLILALAPSANTPEQINAARTIAAFITERTGYAVVVTTPESQAALVGAFKDGNVHIALLDPLSYALAYQQDSVRAQYAVLIEGEYLYGAQFLASRKSGFVSYFDTDVNENTAPSQAALAQFENKKPCWSEETSPSGYMIPLGLLNQAQVQVRPAAFVGGQTTVVRSLYAGGICDFGATYIDARKFPSLEDSMPDLVEQVQVIWRIPAIIPHEVFVFSSRMPEPMQNLFRDLVPVLLQTDAGGAAFQTTFGTRQLQPVNDGDLREFHLLMRESLLDLSRVIQ